MAKKRKMTEQEEKALSADYATAAIAFREILLRMAGNDRERAKEIGQQAITFMFDHPAMRHGLEQEEGV